jgi:hypothetical protein
MKTLDEIAASVIKKVHEIDPNTKISDGDISVISGCTMAIMYDEDITNIIKRDRAALSAPVTPGEVVLKDMPIYPLKLEGGSVVYDFVMLSDIKLRLSRLSAPEKDAP